MTDRTRTGSLSPAELRALSEGGAVKSFQRHAIIVNEGDDTDSLYVILSGRVRVFVADESGRELVLGTQGPGEYFGEMVLDGGPRSASVITTEPTRLLVVPRSRFRDFVRNQPDFAIRLVEKLIHRSRLLTASVKSLALMDVYGRVARLLLDLAEERDGALVIQEKLTQQEIASRVGATRETVGKILGDLAQGGYLSSAGKRIVLHKIPPRHW